jgi:hypothetical protein
MASSLTEGGVPPANAHPADSPTSMTFGNRPFSAQCFLLIFQFLDWKTRGHLLCTAKMFSQVYSDNTSTNEPIDSSSMVSGADAFYRFLCQRLSEEHDIYVPRVLPSSDTWKSLFFELFKIRSLWKSKDMDITHYIKTEGKTVSDRFKINVYARFRPFKKLEEDTSKDDTSSNERNEGIEVTLPLHQRLAMIRMSHNLKSNRQALKMLMKEGGWFQAKWATEKTENNDSIDGSKESASGVLANSNTPGKAPTPAEKMVASVQNLDAENGRAVVICPDIGLREFSFDAVLPPPVSQQTTYDRVARRLVMDVINGFNATAIVYGQTGSGKTYSMFGEDGDVDNIGAKGAKTEGCHFLSGSGDSKVWCMV